MDDVTQFIGGCFQVWERSYRYRDRATGRAFFQDCNAYGVSVAAAIEQGRYIALDAADTLSTFVVNNAL